MPAAAARPVGGSGFRVRGRAGRVRLGRVVEQGGLVGPRALGLGAVEPAEELVEPVPHAAEFAVPVLQEREQLPDHRLEGVGVVGQCDVGGGGVRPHAP